MVATARRIGHVRLPGRPTAGSIWFGQLTAAIGHELFDLAMVYEATGSTPGA